MELDNSPNDRGMSEFGNLLNSKEAAKYLKISVSTLYKLTIRRVIPYTKPGGKLKYFEKSKLEAYLSSRGFPTRMEIEKDFNNHLNKNYVLPFN
ncbi:MAG: helix-turn-helix domain-containing protein [Ferruginibacter sp.]|nr:helix-turn-helix domain-containing protein [Ferruginibacter sp.]